MAFKSPLLRTTTTPIWVHPLAWNLDHLTLLHISVQPVSTGTYRDEQDTIKPEIGRLSVGFISGHELLLLHRIHKSKLLDTYLAMFITKVVDNFQRRLRSKPFRFKSAADQLEPPTSIFRFGTTYVKVKSELIVQTKRGFPFLMYNCPRSTTGFRGSRSDLGLRRLPASVKRTLRFMDFTSELIDPFYVSGLLSLAQKQQKLLQCLHQPLPDMFKVYLITPHPSSAAVFLYSARFPLSYMSALQDPRLEATETVNITRELIELPASSENTGGDTIDGRFLDALTQILEAADRYETRFSKVHRCKKQSKTRRSVRYMKFEKMAKRLNIQMVPEGLLSKRKAWRKVRGRSRGSGNVTYFPKHKSFATQSILRKLDYVSSLRPLIRMCLVPRFSETAEKS